MLLLPPRLVASAGIVITIALCALWARCMRLEVLVEHVNAGLVLILLVCRRKSVGEKHIDCVEDLRARIILKTRPSLKLRE